MTRTGMEADAKRIGINILNLLIKNDKTQNDLAQALGVSKSTVSSWTNGTRIPRMDKIVAMTSFFHCRRSDILGEPDDRSVVSDEMRDEMLRIVKEQIEKERGVQADGQADEYYDDTTVRIVADRLRTNPEYGVMFKAAANLSPEDMELVLQFINRMS